MKRALALALLSTSACAAFAPVPPREPAVHGMPVDELSADFSAVWVGHATVLMRFGSRYVLADPNLGGSLLVVPRITRASLTARELPPIDAVVLSHMHFDHYDPHTLRKLGPRPVIFYPKEGERYADEIEQPHRMGLVPWQSVELPGGIRVTAVPARHSGGRFGIDFLWNHAFTGYVIEGEGKRVFFAGDTGWDEHIFAEIGRRFPGIDVAFIPIAPSRGEDGKKDRWGHVGPAQALDIFRAVGARYMVPIHFEAYFASGERVGEPRQKLAAELEKRHLAGSVFALHTGERFVLEPVEKGGPLVLSEPISAHMASRYP